MTVRRLLRAESAVTSRLSEVEVASALARLTREQVLSPRKRDRALAMVADDFRRFWIVELVPDVVTLARDLLVRHAIRAADAVQLASCLYIRKELSEPVPLVVYDERLVKAALVERIPVVPRQRQRM